MLPEWHVSEGSCSPASSLHPVPLAWLALQHSSRGTCSLQHRSHRADTLRSGAEHRFVVTLLPPTGSGLFISFLRG